MHRRTKSAGDRSEILAVEDSATQAQELKYVLEQADADMYANKRRLSEGKQR